MLKKAIEPKYLTIANALKERIKNGQYEIGSQLPTEAAFACEFASSKQTIRNAIGLLQDWGLAFSRRGSGTIVRSKGGAKQFVQKVGTMGELIQHGPQSCITQLDCEQLTLSTVEAELIHSANRENWWRVCLLRSPEIGAAPDALLYLYFQESHLDLIEIIAKTPALITHELLQEGYGEQVSEVAQDIFPHRLSASMAEKLQVSEGDAGLKVVRRYYGAHRKLIWSAIAFHPPGFTYTSWFSREAKQTS
ncbi:MAG: GntR family transcriptional regulator [Sneathiella sp.]